MLRRLGIYAIAMLLTFLSVSFLVFAMIDHSSGDSSAYLLSENAGEAEIMQFRESLGLDEPFWGRYRDFLASFLSGEWGRTASGFDIRAMIGHSAPVTATLSMLSLILSLMIAIPLSVKGSRKGSPESCAVSVFTLLVMSLPSFLLALFLIALFSFLPGLFPVAGYVPPSRGMIPHLRSLFLPSLTLALLHSSLYIRVFRKALRQGLSSPYSLFALSTGMRERELPAKSAMKPAFPVLLSLIAESFASALGGAAVIETVFALPGVGALMVDAALSRDGQLAGVLMILLSIASSAVFFMLEVILSVVDPRVRRGR